MNTNSVSGIIQTVDEWIDKLNGWPSWAVVALGCLVLGFSLKQWSTFPNKLIPLAVVAFGGAFYAFMAPDHPSNIPVHRWKAQCFITGMLIGFSVWLFHNKLWKWACGKFPILQSIMPNGFNTDTFTKPNNDTLQPAPAVVSLKSEQSETPKQEPK